MAFGGHELLLIVRAQNQASQALRRVAMDAQRLGNIKDMHLRQGQLAINQSQLLSQRQTRLNELAKIEEAQGSRALSMNQRQLRNKAQILGNLNQLSRAQRTYNKIAGAGITGAPLIEAGRNVEKYDKQLRAARVGTAQLAAEETNLARRASVLRSEIGTTNARLAQNAQQMGAIDKAIRVQRWDKVQTGGRIMTHLGRVMQMAGLVGGAALGFLAHSAAQYNSQITLVATQTGPIGSGFAKIASNAKFLQTALLGVMRQGTATRDELTAAAYDIFSSLTLPGTNMQQLKGGVAILRQLNQAAVAGATPIQDVGNAVISVLGAFKDITPTGEHVHKLLQRMFAAVRFGRFTFQDFTKVLNTAAPAARAAGQSFDTMAGTIAFLSRPLGVNKAAIGFARLTEILSRQKMVKGLKDLGVNIVNAQGKLLQLPDVIDKITTKFPQLTRGGVALSQFFKKISGTEGTIQARRAFVFLAQQLDRYRLVLGQTTSDNNEFARSQAAMAKTAGVQWGIFLNNLKAFALELGAAVLPALVKLTKPLQDLAHWFENLDAKQKSTIGKYALYGAALLLFGGTVISVGGMILSFIAVMGKFGIAGSGIALILLGIVAAIKVFSGEWNSLSDAVDSGVNAMLGSFKGFVSMSALLVVAALRIKKAFAGIAAMQLGMAATTGLGASAGAGGIRGMIAGIGGAFATGRLTSMYKAETGASRLAAGLSGAAAGAAALPGPLKIAAAAIGLGAAGALLWKLHMRGVREHAEWLASFQRQTAEIGVAPARAATTAGRFGLDVRDVQRQSIAVQGLNAEIGDTRRQIQAASKAERPALQRQLMDLIIQRADATDALGAAMKRQKASSDAGGQSLKLQAFLLAQIGNTSNKIKRIRDEMGRLSDAYTGATKTGTDLNLNDSKRASQYEFLGRRVKMYEKRLNELAEAANVNARKISVAFTRNVRDLQKLEMLPKKIPRGAIDAMLNLTALRGRRLSLPEMKAVIRAYLNKGDLAKMPRDIRAAVGRAKANIKLQIQRTQAAKDFSKFAKTDLGKAIPALAIRAKTDASSVSKTKGHIKGVFKQPINQPIHLGPVTPNAVALGLQIANGIAAGVYAGGPAINDAVASVVQAGIAAGSGPKGAHAQSPSKVTKNKIGIPLAQGIAVGVLSQMGLIEKTARLAVDFFNGPWLTSPKFTEAKKKVHIHVRDLIKDLRMQVQQFRVFNNALARLARRGVPLALLDQLSQLGVEGAKKIAMLANATDKQLRKYVALWRKAMREIRRSQRSNFDEIVTNLHDFVDQAAHTLLDKWKEIHDGLIGIWTGLFEGFDDKIGEGFKSALESWQSNVDDLNKQIVDLNQQIIDVQRQARDKISDEFGHLFDGAVLASEEIQNKLNWGIALNMGDLTRDLQSQLDAFNKWRGNLASLAGKIPADMLKALVDLGPQAAAQIQALANATGPELVQYVALWQQSQAAINAATQDALPDKAEFQKQIDDLLGQIKDLMDQIAVLVTQKPVPLTPADLISGIQGQADKLGQFTDLIDQLRERNVPQQLLAQLAQLGPDALPELEALNAMTEEQLTTYVGIWTNMQKQITAETKKLMKDQIDAWKQHGADIAAGIIAGIMDEQEALLKFFRKLFLKLLKEARKETKSNSPSKVFAGLGEDIISGLNMGLEKGQRSRISIPALGVTGGAGGVGGAGTTINVHAHHDESLMSTMERAAFRLRNRRS